MYKRCVSAASETRKSAVTQLRFGGGLRKVALAAFALGAVFAAAQQQPACVPNTATYPCVYVANQVFGAAFVEYVSVINATGNKVVGNVGIGDVANGVAITPDNAFLYVAIGGNNFSVEVIDTATGTLSTTITTLTGGASPTQIAITPDGMFAYVVESNSDSEVIDRISTASNTVVDSVKGITLPSAIAFSPDSKLAYVADLCFFQVSCVDIVDITATPPTVTSSIQIPNFTSTGSIAITPDGSIVCVTVSAVTPAGPDTQLACINTTNQNSISLSDLGNAGLTPYGLATTPGGTMYVAEPGGPNAPSNSVVSIDPTTTPPTLLKTIQVGSGPIGLAMGPGGQSVYVTNTNDNSVSIIDTASNAVVTLGNGNGFSFPQGVAAMSANPPIITTEPLSQVIPSGQTASLSVAATSAAPAFYQWYQGLSGDTSVPLRGAFGSSFITPPLTSTTSYWVAVANVAGIASSTTATITVTTSQPPACTLSVNGAGSPTFSDPLTVIAAATCIDPQGEALTTSIDFGDGTSTSGVNSGVFTASHTYPTYPQGQPQETFPISVVATDASQLQSPPAVYSWTLVGTPLVTPVFSGQTSVVTVQLASPSGQPELVEFKCTTVTTTQGSAPVPASSVGISCSSTPTQIQLNATPQTVTLVIQTTGKATSAALNPGNGTRNGTWTHALWEPLPVVAFLGLVLMALVLNSIRSPRRRFSVAFALSGMFVLALFTVSCGGGFTAPQVINATPAGNYQVTVIDVPVGSSSGFEQTSLIVPLTVSPFQ